MVRRSPESAPAAPPALAIEMIPPGLLNPAVYNPRTIDPESFARLKRGIQRFGLVDPIVARRFDHLVVGGHQRLRAALDLGLDSVPVVLLDLSDEEAAALNVLLNNPNAQGSWDLAALAGLIGDLGEAGFDTTLTGFDQSQLDSILSGSFGEAEDTGDEEDEEAEGDPGGENYSRKIEAPIYLPKGERPELGELLDRARTEERRAEIAEAEAEGRIPREIADFLRFAAERHTVFRFDRIAEFYAHADEQTQELMERSALVIIDYDQAIELGYVKLTEAMMIEAGKGKAMEEASAHD